MTIGIGPSGALLHTIGIGIEIGLGIGIGQWKHTINMQLSRRKEHFQLMSMIRKYGYNEYV